MCNCAKKQDFKIALREAFATTTETQKMVVWENGESKEVFIGTEEQAKARLQKGVICCYAVPKERVNDEVSFEIVEAIKEPVKKEGK